MALGYPAEKKPAGLTEEEARYATANAIRFWLSENQAQTGINYYQYSFTNRQNNPGNIIAKSGYQNVLDFSDWLLQQARNQQPLEHSINFSPRLLGETTKPYPAAHLATA